MSKYYIKCGTIELIRSMDFGPIEAAIQALWDTNSNDILDEHFYIDERGMYDHNSAKPDTTVISLKKVAKLAGWTLGKDQE